MSLQLINSCPEGINPHNFRVLYIDSKWMQFFSTILSAVPKCFIIIEILQSSNTNDKNWYQWLLDILEDVVASAGHNGQALKVLILASTTLMIDLSSAKPSRIFHSTVRSTLTPIPRSRILAANQNTSIIDKLRTTNFRRRVKAKD